MITSSREALDALYDPFMAEYRKRGMTVEFAFEIHFHKYDNGEIFDYLETYIPGKIYDDKGDHGAILWNKACDTESSDWIEKTVQFGINNLQRLVDMSGRMPPTRAQIMQRIADGKADLPWWQDPVFA